MNWRMWSTSNPEEEQQIILQEARQQAEAMVRQAAAQAERIIQDTRIFTEEVQTSLRGTLLTSVQDSVEAHKRDLAAGVAAYKANLQQLLDELQRSGQEQIAAVGKEGAERLRAAEESLIAYSQKQRAEIDALLLQEKDRRLQQWQVLAEEQIPQIVRSLIGKAVRLQDHKELVQAKLEELKRLRA